MKQELLVRYLYAWAPAALHHARQVTYLDGYPSPSSVAAATGVFSELADVLAGHQLTMVLPDGVPAGPPGELPDGLAVRAAGDLLADLRATRALRGPVLAFLDAGGRAPAQDLLAALGGARAAEILLVRDPNGDPAGLRASLLAAGFRFAVVVELVANAGGAQQVFFATSAMRSLERFKDALWAVDEYAGVRYRDPRDGQHPPLDISLEPHVGPLRRALVAYLATDRAARSPDARGATVAQLREYALSDTLYRPADVNRALQPLLAAGQVIREPERGRLTPQTVISLPASR
ncbi:MAG: hypothetical protein IRZ05_00240 [Micromonosporaceae bacterium]|nr:hypothetical protein [Micromonosporaceae bacterium]